MTRSIDFGDEPRHDDLLSFVAKEVQRVLAQHEEVIKERSSISSHVKPCSKRPQGIHDRLTALAFEFVLRLAAEAGRRSHEGVGETAPPSVRTEGAREGAVLEARDQQNDCQRIEDWAGTVAGPTYLKVHFGIPRSTLHWWQRHNDVVALRKGARKHVFPLAQFVDGRPAPGIRQVLSLIANPRAAWLWLTSPSPQLDGRTPIELLRQELAAEVLRAARDFSLTLK
ncbi:MULTISPECIES: antitoxin Xre/MbcA/ParS toxin-binding domain-containing protein [unclassified Mesorhizobium]|uniref:antitoxin Xre/MbcA/ParS-like domain-containing protein n=1 Tax=unclassified Mesorhizobium TaxID=325217 RepID=UPI000FC9EF25|nr:MULTISPECIES: antitoxin Xre/MbcA/ParS toxin-binding domain-containing protein [unclassified Mesorhizobium]RVC45304.1 DUF2384 domain-containing protein [Mesorhizobium sp. M4A.F.Ca.ET.090.04.2.1]RWD53728.1 MAG: DUF2384 domain-containing protein [Mesorhizobium sp.]RWJ22612.1 MAG: DUF2384 domain-containing protein [Mesorhizobium sp.]RWN15083.1 MAG: DUF2384 domain-containing protein [Mesorhizobium sp.]RWN21003.1 MAG: DUF2384 domain-containing protein [Mesorhizobium sp.]